MRSEHYRQHAQECLRLASDSSDPSCKAVLLDMAMAWMRLAEQAAALYTRPYARLPTDNDLQGDALLPEPTPPQQANPAKNP
jgi:hypothetical protein